MDLYICNVNIHDYTNIDDIEEVLRRNKVEFTKTASRLLIKEGETMTSIYWDGGIVINIKTATVDMFFRL